MPLAREAWWGNEWGPNSPHLLVVFILSSALRGQSLSITASGRPGIGYLWARTFGLTAGVSLTAARVHHAVMSARPMR